MIWLERRKGNLWRAKCARDWSMASGVVIPSSSSSSSHHLSVNREGRWGTTDDFTTTFLFFSLFSTALWVLAKSRPVHSPMLSSHLFPESVLYQNSRSLSFTRTPTVCPLTEVPLSFLSQNSHCLSLTRTPIVCPLPELQWSVLYQNSHSLFFIRTPIVVFVFECSK